jgi:hypothetical protein
MCYSRSSILSEERRRQELKDRQVLQEKRAGLVERLLGDANKQAQEAKVETKPAKESAPAK